MKQADRQPPRAQCHVFRHFLGKALLSERYEIQQERDRCRELVSFGASYEILRAQNTKTM